jgi:hypothetical protein
LQLATEPQPAVDSATPKAEQEKGQKVGEEETEHISTYTPTRFTSDGPSNTISTQPTTPSSGAPVPASKSQQTPTQPRSHDKRRHAVFTSPDDTTATSVNTSSSPTAKIPRAHTPRGGFASTACSIRLIRIPETQVKRENERKQRQAFKEKVCAACGKKPENYQSIHAHLNAECEKTHSWDKDIICVNCLVQHITSRIFPEGTDKFAISEPRCWAEGCRVVLSHEDIKRYINPELFEKYNEALTQQALHSNSDSAQCANTAIKCRGGAWFSPADLEEMTFFRCSVCQELTCLQCDSLYRTHFGRPCPAGLAMRKREEEDEKSEMEVKRISKECECGARIQKTDGCDHMTCETTCRLGRGS